MRAGTPRKWSKTYEDGIEGIHRSLSQPLTRISPEEAKRLVAYGVQRGWIKMPCNSPKLNVLQ